MSWFSNAPVDNTRIADPTPAEITAARLALQASWSDRQRRSREGGPTGSDLPVYCASARGRRLVKSSTLDDSR